VERKERDINILLSKDEGTQKRNVYTKITITDKLGNNMKRDCESGKRGNKHRNYSEQGWRLPSFHRQKTKDEERLRLFSLYPEIVMGIQKKG
jgi:hypothetical protein